MSTAVSVRNLTVKFGDFTAVNNISFTVEKGEIFGFLGANGAGKTTTIRVLCGVLEPTSGDVEIAGLGFASGARAVKSKVGYMSQRFTLYGDLTVKENLAFTGAIRNLGKENLKKRIEESLSFIGFDQKYFNATVQDLPAGVKQQVSLAASVLHDPEVLFLDEPTSGVTPASRAKFWKLIRLLAENGKTVFVTTHYLDEAENCGRIALMRDGEIIALDNPEALKDKTFTLPLFSIRPRQTKTPDWSTWLAKNDVLDTAPKAYGLSFHVIVKDDNKWKTFVAKFGSDLRIEPIKPSLEDVFIKLVEREKA